MTTAPSVNIIQVVHDAYNAKAKSGSDATYSIRVAQAFGYTLEQLQAIPAESNLGLGCGNPITSASIKESVLDLGCGGGIDVLLAASKVGTTGQVIGLDMSIDMISRARRNAESRNFRPPQVSFMHASLTGPLPITACSIDCILSNCVISLLPLSAKGHLFKEAHRVLKPGGRIVFDDIVVKKTFTDEIRNDLTTFVGCISGAIEVDVYKQLLVEAGFSDILFVDTHGDINAYYASDEPSTAGCCSVPLTNSNVKTSCCSSASKAPQKQTKNLDTNEWVATCQIYASKPAEANSKAADV